MANTKQSPKTGVAVVTGATNVALSVHLLRQVQETLWRPSYMNEGEQLIAVTGAVAALEGIAPADELEGMLGVQMIATHNAALECLRRAAKEQQTFEGRHANLKDAEKLMALYLRQLEALDRRRGKVAPSVSVGAVHVGAGGQAVVGVVNRSAEPEQEPSEQPALEHQPVAPIIPLGQRQRSRVQRNP